jgi:GMP synthase (glutamine-hydrolysing)
MATSSPPRRPGFAVVATSANAPVAAMEDARRAFYGLLFHPEVAHTEQGRRSSATSPTTSAAARATGPSRSFIDEAIGERSAQQVGDGRVVCG